MAVILFIQYFSLVLPHIDYWDLVYSCTKVANLQKLQKLQNIACTTVLWAGRKTTTKEMHKELDLLTLEQRRELHLATERYKPVKSPKSNLSDYFWPNTMWQTRCGDIMELPNLKTNMGTNAFTCCGPYFGNKLDNIFKTSENVEQFKKQYFKELMRDVNHRG